jgi:hypothetical protein
VYLSSPTVAASSIGIRYRYHGREQFIVLYANSAAKVSALGERVHKTIAVLRHADCDVLSRYR